MEPPDELPADVELPVEGLLCLLHAMLNKKKITRIGIRIEINIDTYSIFIPAYLEIMLKVQQQ